MSNFLIELIGYTGTILVTVSLMMSNISFFCIDIVILVFNPMPMARMGSLPTQQMPCGVLRPMRATQAAYRTSQESAHGLGLG